jgi:SPX domain protein involved in polyphosphate accumulation
MSNTNKPKYRYERKSYITELSEYEVEDILRTHPAIFSEAFIQRYVNNIYFDSFSFNNYYDNIEGITDRIKIRVRWYGNLFGAIDKPTLEIKIKKGLLGKKISMPIKPFFLNKETNIGDILASNAQLQDSLMFDLNSLEPSLMNQYLRKYYKSCNGHFRITVDTNQLFYMIKKQNNYFLNQISDKNSVILELKYDEEYDSEASNITSIFPFRVTKNSKYVNGVQKIYNMSF